MIRVLLLLGLFLSFSTNLLADKVVLVNGDVLTGTVIAWRDGNFEIKTALVGDVKAPWKSVRSIETEKPLYFVSKERAIQCKALAINADQLTLSGAGCDGVVVQRARLDSILSQKIEQEQEGVRHAGIQELWTANFDAGLNAARSDASNTNFNLGMKAIRATYADRIVLNTTALFSRTESQTGDRLNTTAVRAGVRYARNLSPRFFAFGFGNFETDELQSLDLRRVLGSGLGYKLAASKRLRFDVFSGGSFLQEYFTGLPSRTAGELLFGQEVSFKPGKFDIAETASIYPNLTNRGEYRVSFDSSVGLALNSWFSWQTTVSNIFISDPPTGTPGNSLVLSTGFRILLGKERKFEPNARVVGY